MNNAHVNQAMRCLRGVVSSFAEHARRHNPGLVCDKVEVSPRDTNTMIPRDCDMYISTGGPGSPFEGEGQPWSTDYGRFCDHIVDSAVRNGTERRALFAICYLVRDGGAALQGGHHRTAQRSGSSA